MRPIRDPETYAVIGAAMAVHRELGHGFLEAVYQEALAHEFLAQAIPHKREVALPILYRGRVLSHAYRVDFICFSTLLVELKALTRVTPVEESQVIHYLKAAGLQRALLLNFGAMSLEVKRIVLGLPEKKKTYPQITQIDAD